MKRFFTLVAATLLFAGADAMAQVSVDDVAASSQKQSFENDMKTTTVDADYVSEAKRRADRMAIRKERNTVDFTANLHGSLTAFNKHWQAAGDNTITILANVNFLHTYKKNKFTRISSWSPSCLAPARSMRRSASRCSPTAWPMLTLF